MAETPASLPEAKVVDRDATYRKAASIGMALFAAVWTMLMELPASLLLFLVIAAIDDHRVQTFSNAIVVVLFILLAYMLVNRIVRAREIDFKLKGGSYDVPSTSWAHALFDAIYLAFGVLFVIPGYHPRPGWQEGSLPVDFQFDLGLAFIILPGTLLVLRIVFWKRREVRCLS